MSKNPLREGFSTDKPSDPFEDALSEVYFRYGGETWFAAAEVVSDDAGKRIAIKVFAERYSEDVLPRKMDDFFLVVIKVGLSESLDLILS